MRFSELLYCIEMISTIVIILIGLILIEYKHKKFYSKFLKVVLSILIITLGITFVFEKPDIYSNDLIICQVKENKEIQKPNTIYHFENITDKVRIIGDIDYNKLGEYDISFEVDTLVGIYSKNAKVVVVDTKAPEITLKGEKTYSQSYSKEYKEPGFIAKDNYDGDITNKVKTVKRDIDKNNFVITYTVQDSFGNKAETTRNVKIVDDIAPKITLEGYEDITVYLGDKYKEKGATAIDEKDGDLTDKIKISGDVNTSKRGKYIVTYEVTDNSGNKATKKREVYVKKESEIKKQENTTSSGRNKIVYLTFDDGPSSYTNELLDILKEYNVKATFFVTGNGSDDIIKREYDEGHTVALHTNSHDYSYVYSSKENFFNDLYAIQSRVERITGHKSYIMRFPGGSSNTVSRNYDGGTRIMSYLTKEVVDRGFRYFDWNVSSGDAGGTTSTDKVYKNVVNNLKSGTSVVLQHDIKKFSIDAVPRIIEYGLENGYTFDKITEDVPMVTHGINN